MSSGISHIQLDNRFRVHLRASFPNNSTKLCYSWSANPETFHRLIIATSAYLKAFCATNPVARFIEGQTLMPDY